VADPITATIAVISIAGGAIGAVQSLSNARARNNELEANARAADINSQIAANNAALEARRRDRELTENRRKYNLLKGETRAQSGALGIFGGSTLDILADMDGMQLFEQTAIVDERTSAQQSYYNQSAAFKNQARGMRGAQQSGALGAIGSLLNGFGGALGGIQSAGGFGGGGGSLTSDYGLLDPNY
jgi:hypothetical protein